MRNDGRNEPELEQDQALVKSFGAYASYVTPDDPEFVEFYGESPAEEMDRMLDKLAGPGDTVLDLGCGGGFTLCRLAPKVGQIWGLDQEDRLLTACKARVESRRLPNAKVVSGNVADPAIGERFPAGIFDLVFSRRGPFVTGGLLSALKPDAIFLIEFAQDYLGLKDIFGRNPMIPRSPGDPEWAISSMGEVGFIPVTAKTFWYEEWFRDEDHLARYLSAGASLSHWWLEPCPYLESRDRPALDLYAKYNRGERGIRLTGCRKIYLFRRGATKFYPVTGTTP